jgi:hypothetical protein
MTASYPTIAYLDLIQAYDLKDIRRYPPKEYKSDSNSVMGLLEKEDYKIFRHIAKTAQMNGIMDDPQFNLTLLLPKDNDIKRQGIDMNFIMDLDRDSSRMILNYHILKIKMNLKSLDTRRICKLDTRRPQSEISLIKEKNGSIKLNNSVYISGEEITCNNGIVIPINGLLYPPELIKFKRI